MKSRKFSMDLWATAQFAVHYGAEPEEIVYLCVRKSGGAENTQTFKFLLFYYPINSERLQAVRLREYAFAPSKEGFTQAMKMMKTEANKLLALKYIMLASKHVSLERPKT